MGEKKQSVVNSRSRTVITELLQETPICWPHPEARFPGSAFSTIEFRLPSRRSPPQFKRTVSFIFFKLYCHGLTFISGGLGRATQDRECASSLDQSDSDVRAWGQISQPKLCDFTRRMHCYSSEKSKILESEWSRVCETSEDTFGVDFACTECHGFNFHLQGLQLKCCYVSDKQEQLLKMRQNVW